MIEYSGTVEPLNDLERQSTYICSVLKNSRLRSMDHNFPRLQQISQPTMIECNIARNQLGHNQRMPNRRRGRYWEEQAIQIPMAIPNDQLDRSLQLGNSSSSLMTPNDSSASWMMNSSQLANYSLDQIQNSIAGSDLGVAPVYNIQNSHQPLINQQSWEDSQLPCGVSMDSGGIWPCSQYFASGQAFASPTTHRPVQKKTQVAPFFQCAVNPCQPQYVPYNASVFVPNRQLYPVSSMAMFNCSNAAFPPTAKSVSSQQVRDSIYSNVRSLHIPGNEAYYQHPNSMRPIDLASISPNVRNNNINYNYWQAPNSGSIYSDLEKRHDIDGGGSVQYSSLSSIEQIRMVENSRQSQHLDIQKKYFQPMSYPGYMPTLYTDRLLDPTTNFHTQPPPPPPPVQQHLQQIPNFHSVNTVMVSTTGNQSQSSKNQVFYIHQV